MATVNKPQSAGMYPGPGYRVKKTFSRPAPEIVEQYRLFETPDISDMLNRLYTMSSVIQNRILGNPEPYQ